MQVFWGKKIRIYLWGLITKLSWQRFKKKCSASTLFLIRDSHMKWSSHQIESIGFFIDSSWGYCQYPMVTFVQEKPGAWRPSSLQRVTFFCLLLFPSLASCDQVEKERFWLFFFFLTTGCRLRWEQYSSWMAKHHQPSSPQAYIISSR